MDQLQEDSSGEEKDYDQLEDQSQVPTFDAPSQGTCYHTVMLLSWHTRL